MYNSYYNVDSTSLAIFKCYQATIKCSITHLRRVRNGVQCKLYKIHCIDIVQYMSCDHNGAVAAGVTDNVLHHFSSCSLPFPSAAITLHYVSGTLPNYFSSSPNISVAVSAPPRCIRDRWRFTEFAQARAELKSRGSSSWAETVNFICR